MMTPLRIVAIENEVLTFDCTTREEVNTSCEGVSSTKDGGGIVEIGVPRGMPATDLASALEAAAVSIRKFSV